MLAFQPGEEIAQVMDLRTYEDKPYMVIAINLRDVEGEDGELRPDELVAARLVASDDKLMLVSRKGLSLTFEASDSALRPMGRATSGVKGMSFRDDDVLLAMDVVTAGSYSFVVTEAATPSARRWTSTASR